MIIRLTTKSSFIFLVTVILIMLSISCHLPALPQSSNATPSITPAVDFLKNTPDQRNQNKIIIRSIIPDSQSRISEINLELPKELIETQIYANDNLIKTDMVEGGICKITFSNSTAEKKVNLSFKLNENQLAFCLINGEKLLAPEGDCSW